MAQHTMAQDGPQGEARWVAAVSWKGLRKRLEAQEQKVKSWAGAWFSGGGCVLGGAWARTHTHTCTTDKPGCGCQPGGQLEGPEACFLLRLWLT